MNYCGFGINGIYQDPRDGQKYFYGICGCNGNKFNKLGYVIFLGFWSIDLTMKRPLLKSLAVMASLILSAYCLFCNFLTYHEIGLARNFVTKNTWIQKDAGFHFTNPFVLVQRIDTRPVRVSVHSSSKCVSSKLVQFVPEEWESFVKTEGWRFYWWSNRLSFNWSYPEEYRGWRDVMRGYAYSTKRYPFIKTIEEYEEK